MSQKFDELIFEAEGKPRKVYTFEANCEYQGNTFHKFQRMVQLKDGKKWQTLTVTPREMDEFIEWLEYIISEMKGVPGAKPTPDPEDIPF